MSGRPTDLKYQFRVGYGKPVVCTRVSKPKGGKQPGTTRNEFGICVGPGGANGAVLVYLPSRGTHAMSLRYHVRKIRFGSTRQRTVEEGRKYLPRLGEDGAWHLVAQGEASELGKQFAALVDDDLTCPIEFDRAEIATHEMDSSIAFDSVMQHLSTMKMEEEIESEGFAEVHMDKITGAPCDENGVPIKFGEHATEQTDVPIQVPLVQPPVARERRVNAGQNRYRDFVGAVADGAYHAFMVTLFWVGMIVMNDGYAFGSTVDDVPLQLRPS